MLYIIGFCRVNSSSAPFKDIRTAKKLPGTTFPDYLPLCIILLKFHCLFAQFWYTTNKGLIWHFSTLFQMSHIHIHKFQVILNKVIPVLSCYTAMHGMMKKSARICSTIVVYRGEIVKRRGHWNVGIIYNVSTWTFEAWLGSLIFLKLGYVT